MSSFCLTSSNIDDSTFDRTLRTYLIIHGFIDFSNDSWILNIKNAILSQENANVIAVDWSQGSAALQGDIESIFTDPPYITAVNNVKIVALKTAVFLAQANIDPLTTHCIGHSLGAHCCGELGQSNKLDRITGILFNCKRAYNYV